ncbi:MAG TPA: heme-binding protein [Stellaceae bacterium]|nr:heme-binding protein [Stellaceae bacterium]
MAMMEAPRADDAADDTRPLTLEEGRRYIDRALAKAKELRQCGAFAVVDAAGNVLSISKMDGAPAASSGVARAKAFVAAVMQQRTLQFTERMNAAPERFAAYRDIFGGIGMPGGVGFPGAGGVPIMRDLDHCVGGFASGPGIQPAKEVQGVHPAKLEAGRTQGNAEDIIVCHAVGIPYRSQHG